MRYLKSPLFASLLAVPALLLGQLAAPNASGVSIGHLHLTVRDPEVHKKLWVLLG